MTKMHNPAEGKTWVRSWCDSTRRLTRFLNPIKCFKINLRKGGILSKLIDHSFDQLTLAYRFSGKLLLRTEIPLSDKFLHQLIQKGYFTPIPSISKTFFTLKCKRCNNQKQSLFAKFPCKTCQESHFYCRKCIEMGKVIECEPLYYWTGLTPEYPKIDEPCTWQGKLADNQVEAASR